MYIYNKYTFYFRNTHKLFILNIHSTHSTQTHIEYVNGIKYTYLFSPIPIYMVPDIVVCAIYWNIAYTN